MRCKGITRLLRRCMNRTEGSELCFMHKNQNNCPVCFEIAVEELNCGHTIHSKCMMGLRKMECPLCRAELVNIPEKIKYQINKNIIKEKIEQERDYETDILINEIDIQSLLDVISLIFSISYVRDIMG